MKNVLFWRIFCVRQHPPPPWRTIHTHPGVFCVPGVSSFPDLAPPLSTPSFPIQTHETCPYGCVSYVWRFSLLPPPFQHKNCAILVRFLCLAPSLPSQAHETRPYGHVSCAWLSPPAPFSLQTREMHWKQCVSHVQSLLLRQTPKTRHVWWVWCLSIAPLHVVH